jgi:Zn-finger nucleic acid-binding protein
MNCAKCQGVLEPQSFGDEIVIHRCNECSGLFLKPDMLMAMKQARMSEAVLDTGDPKVGRVLDRLDDVACPECGTTMCKRTDERQAHIWYESCPNCDGLWLDAGEFTDLKFETLMDRLRTMIKGRRPEDPNQACGG